MPWPTPQDYNEAIQNPRASFADPELRTGKPELTRLGLPRPITGNFASVYRMGCSGRDWAVRCFFREYADMGERYAAISRHLAAARLPYTVGFEYLEQGIRVRGTWYPILKMEWVEGELLNTFIARNLDNPARLKSLADRWLQMLDALRRASIAHGDLQHGNVLVVGESLKLVDYDGMFVPRLAGRISHEIGHPNYQHPARSGRHFTPAVDRFSAGVVYLSLLGVAAQRDLWDRLGGGDECLLFRKADFDSPARSEAFSLLGGVSEPRARMVTADLRRALARDPLDVPLITQTASVRQSSGAPDWVEQLRPPVPARSFGTQPSQPRLALAATTLAGVASLAAWAVMLVSLFMWMAAAALTADLCLLLLFFARDPTVVARTRVKRRARQSNRALGRLERRLDRYQRAREARHDLFAADSLRAAGIRDALKSQEQKERDAVEEVIGDRIVALHARLEELDQMERDAVSRLLTLRQERHVRSRLTRASLLRSSISGVSWLVRCDLWLKGIRNAEHITSRAPRLAALPSSQVTSILMWRVEVESAAKRTMPSSVAPYRKRPIIDAATRQRRRLTRTRARTESRQRVLLTHIESRYAGKRSRLEESLREKEVRLQADLAAIEEGITAARQEEPVQNRRAASAARELEPFRNIGLARFMRFLLLP